MIAGRFLTIELIESLWYCGLIRLEEKPLLKPIKITLWGRFVNDLGRFCEKYFRIETMAEDESWA
jgi:hypothetical protein